MPRKPGYSPKGPLTPKMRQVLDGLLAGELPKNVAADLNITSSTYQKAVKALKMRLGAKTIIHAVVMYDRSKRSVGDE